MTAERARITVFDTTLRDGEQSPGCSMNHQEKLLLAHQLDRLGVDVIEAVEQAVGNRDRQDCVVREPAAGGKQLEVRRLRPRDARL